MVLLLEQLYLSEVAVARMWFDLFRRFPMVEDSERYFDEALLSTFAYNATIMLRDEIVEILDIVRKEYGEEAAAETLKKIQAHFEE